MCGWLKRRFKSREELAGKTIVISNRIIKSLYLTKFYWKINSNACKKLMPFPVNQYQHLINHNINNYLTLWLSTQDYQHSKTLTKIVRLTSAILNLLKHSNLHKTLFDVIQNWTKSLRPFLFCWKLNKQSKN